MNHKSAPFSNWFVVEQARKQVHPQSQEAHQLFSKRQFNLWMEGLVDFLNKNDEVLVTWTTLFDEWNVEKLQMVLEYFLIQSLLLWLMPFSSTSSTRINYLLM